MKYEHQSWSNTLCGIKLLIQKFSDATAATLGVRPPQKRRRRRKRRRRGGEKREERRRRRRRRGMEEEMSGKGDEEKSEGAEV